MDAADYEFDGSMLLAAVGVTGHRSGPYSGKRFAAGNAGLARRFCRSGRISRRHAALRGKKRSAELAEEIKFLRIWAPDVVICADRFWPAHFGATGHNAADAIMVGDTQTDWLAAHHAGYGGFVAIADGATA